MFVKETWYCAGWSEEFTEGVMRRLRIADQDLLFARNSEGALYVLENRCAHRFAPLHMGRLTDQGVECGYHGMVFDASGKCVVNPHGNKVPPPGCRVRSFSLVECYGIVWVWLGKGVATPETIPDLAAYDPAEAHVGRRYLYAKANYLLDVDNILDLSHIQFLHPGTLGSAEVANAKVEVSRDGDHVLTRRVITGERLSPFLEKAFFVTPGQLVDRGLELCWHPTGVITQIIWVTPTGRPAAEGHTRRLLHIFTPETQRTSHYWFSLAYPRALGAEFGALAESGIAGLAVPFETEDLPMLEAQQEAIGTAAFEELNPALIKNDAAAVMARRIVRELMERESA